MNAGMSAGTRAGTKVAWAALALLVVAIAGYLVAWPVPIEPVAWQPAPSPGYTGVHSVNNRLTDLQRIELGGAAGPEHVALGPDGKLYVAVEAGRVLRMAPDGSDREVFVETGGRVLGFDFDAAGTLYAADAIRGLLSIDRSGKLRVLADTMAGESIRYADAVAVATDGKIYFTDASRRFAPRDWGGTFEASVLDILENSATGRVLVYDPAAAASGGAAVQVVAGGLSFANGIVLTRDGQSLLVNETGRYRVWHIATAARGLDLSKPSSMTMRPRHPVGVTPPARVLLNDLPGYPDNLMHGLDGRIWLGFAKPRSAVIDRLAAWPSLRKMTLRLPRAWWPVPKPYGHVIAFTEDGRIVADLQDPSGVYPETTAITETPSRLYVQSLHASWLGWLPPLPAAAIQP
jgi:sugar lactone lactonase YvrE